jgi:hypothetical protein
MVAVRLPQGTDEDYAGDDKCPDNVSRFGKGKQHEVSYTGDPHRDQQTATWRRPLPCHDAEQSPNRYLGDNRFRTAGDNLPLGNDWIVTNQQKLERWGSRRGGDAQLAGQEIGRARSRACRAASVIS